MNRRIAGIFGFFAVALGAFGAHGLKATLETHGTLEIWQTAVLYHLVHTVAILAVGASVWAVRCWSVGILIFSGTLYLYALTKIAWFARITPIGGLFFLAGWLLLVFVATSRKDSGNLK